MTKIEITKRIEQLENQKFMIYMADHWTTEDRNLLNKVEREIEKLQKKLN
jgi:hypothetical protein